MTLWRPRQTASLCSASVEAATSGALTAIMSGGRGFPARYWTHARQEPAQGHRKCGPMLMTTRRSGAHARALWQESADTPVYARRAVSEIARSRARRRCGRQDHPLASGRRRYSSPYSATSSQMSPKALAGLSRPRGTKDRPQVSWPRRRRAVKLDPDENVLDGLHIAEGIESGLAARRLGLRPTWRWWPARSRLSPSYQASRRYLYCASMTEANRKASDACATRWLSAGCESSTSCPTAARMPNDAIRRSAWNDLPSLEEAFTFEQATPPAASGGACLSLKWHGDADDAPLKEWLVDKMLPKVGKALIAGQWGLTRLLSVWI